MLYVEDAISKNRAGVSSKKKTATTITTNNKQILENNKSTRPADDKNARVVSKILLSSIQNRLNNIPLAFHKFVGTTTCIAFQWC